MLIGAVSKQFDIPIDTLRYYDRIGLLRPQRSDGRRQYTEGDLRRLYAIIRMRKLMFSLEEIQTILSVDEQLDRSIEEQCMDTQAVQTLLLKIRVKHQDVEALEQNLIQVKQALAGFITKIEAVLKEDSKNG